MTVLGVDRTRGGWLWVAIGATGLPAVGVVDVLTRLPDAEVVGIDIPLWLPRDEHRRMSERDARRRLGRRASTVFSTFPTWVYEWPKGYDPSLRLAAQTRLGRKPSAQSFHLGVAILEARAVKEANWIEVHPELAFNERCDGSVPPKKSDDGRRVREEILRGEGLELPPLDVTVPIHDLLDAAICAVVSRAHAVGHATPWGDPATGDVIWS